MTEDILLEVPYVDQLADTKNKAWAERACGICSLKMVLGFVKPEMVLRVKVMDLVRRALKTDGYIANIGWKHSALVNLAAEYGLKMKFQKKFPKTLAEKKARLVFVDRQLSRCRPVIASVHRNFEPGRGGHLVVVSGIRVRGGKTLGYHISDPHSKDRGARYYVARNEFLKGWRGGLIWLAS